MPSQKLTPTFCTEDMDMDTLDMPDTMDILMEDIPTLDKLFPGYQNGQPTILVF